MLYLVLKGYFGVTIIDDNQEYIGYNLPKRMQSEDIYEK